MLKFLLVSVLAILPLYLLACPDCGGTCEDCDEEEISILEIQKMANDNQTSYLNWRKAKTAYAKHDYETAISLMNKALDNETHKDNAFLKLERAKMKQMAGDIDSCLNELNEVIEQRESQKLYDNYYVKALYGAVSILAHSDLKLASEMYKKIRKHDKDIPKVDIVQKKEKNVMVYSNLSSIYEDKTVRKLIVKYFIQFGIAKNEDDIDFSEDNVIIVNLPSCMSKKQETKELHSNKDSKQIDFCKENCATISTGAMVACGYLPTNKCRIACTALVEGLRRTCNWCCNSGGFYSKCIKPLEKFFPPPCDPAWD